MLGVYYDQKWINSSNGTSLSPDENNSSREMKFTSLVLLGVQLSEDIQIGLVCLHLWIYIDTLKIICCVSFEQLNFKLHGRLDKSLSKDSSRKTDDAPENWFPGCGLHT